MLAGWAVSGWAQDLPEGQGKEVVGSVCAQCHGLREVTAQKLSRSEWENIVYDMVGRGAPLMEDEIPIVIDYLDASFGKGSAAKVNVNKASAKELETGLELTAQEAGEVVSYREKNGNFSKWEDLQKVPGLDSKKIEAAKDRLAF